MPLLQRIFFCFVASLGLWGSLLPATEVGFMATLTKAQQVAAGLTSLTADERAVLDRLVAEEFTPGREIYAALNANFDQRQTAEARHEAGLDRLSPAQLARLNDHVAAALTPRPRPKERPRIKEGEVLAPKPKGEVHGAVTMGMGWGGGGPTRYGSLELAYVDPELGFSLGIGLYTYTGPGYYGYYPVDAFSSSSRAGRADFLEPGRPVLTNDFYRDRAGMSSPDSVRQYFQPHPPSRGK